MDKMAAENEDSESGENSGENSPYAF